MQIAVRWVCVFVQENSCSHTHTHHTYHTHTVTYTWFMRDNNNNEEEEIMRRKCKLWTRTRRLPFHENCQCSNYDWENSIERKRIKKYITIIIWYISFPLCWRRSCVYSINHTRTSWHERICEMRAHWLPLIMQIIWFKCDLNDFTCTITVPILLYSTAENGINGNVKKENSICNAQTHIFAFCALYFEISESDRTKSAYSDVPEWCEYKTKMPTNDAISIFLFLACLTAHWSGFDLMCCVHSILSAVVILVQTLSCKLMRTKIGCFWFETENHLQWIDLFYLFLLFIGMRK